MTTERRIAAAEGAELRVETRDGKPTIRGYAAVFNSLSSDLGGFVEVIRQGAFRRALSDGQDVRALVDHDPARIIGRNKAGTLRLTEDQRGLLVEIDPPDTTAGRDIVESIRRGDVTGMSFGFVARKDDWRQEGERTIRELHAVDLFDVSAVTYPAYPATEVAVRSLQAFLRRHDPERYRRLVALEAVR